MKSLLILVLILSAAGSAFADSSQFLPKRAVAPAMSVVKSDRMPSRYPAYNRANPRGEIAKPGQASAKMPSMYRAFSRDYRS